MYSLSAKSKSHLEGVHPALISVVIRALEVSSEDRRLQVDFGVLKSVRTPKEQACKVKNGVSKTMNSRHIPENNECELSCAADLMAYSNGQATWAWPFYNKIARAMFRAAIEQGVQIEWGGFWESIKDGPHFQLSWKDYP